MATRLGSEVQEGKQCAGGQCGLVYLEPTRLPAPAKKLAASTFDAKCPQAKSGPGIKVLASVVRRAGARKRWVDLEREDMACLSRTPLPKLHVARVVGPVISGVPAMVTAKSNDMAMAALACRMFRSPPPPEVGVWDIASRLRRDVLPLYDDCPPEMDWREWLDGMPKRRQAPLREAMKLWQDYGWDNKYGEFHSFIKEEILPCIDKDEWGLLPLKSVVARLINAPHDVTHCIAGPKIKPYLAWLKAQWHYQSPLFYGSTTPGKLQKWLTRMTYGRRRMVFWSDYSMFDSSHNEETWALVEDLYRQHRHDADFMRVLNAWRAPKGKIGDLKYIGRVMNASGRDDTAFANAVLNGFAMKLSVCSAWCGVPLEELTAAHLSKCDLDIDISVCGDDALGFMPDIGRDAMLKFRDAVKANLKRFGFDAKFFCSDRYEDAVYLGHRPYQVGEDWFWGKTLGRALYKLGYQRGISGDPCAHFMGICKMHEVCSKHVPVLSDLTQAYLDCNVGCKVNPYTPDENKPWEFMGHGAPGWYDTATLDSVARAYTVDRRPCREDLSPRDVLVTRADVVDLISYIKSAVDGTPCVLDHWLLRHMVWVDDL